MRATPSYSRRSRWPRFLLSATIVTFLFVSGIILSLLILGVNLNPFAKAAEDQFVVRIPINAKPIPAYSRVDRTHLIDTIKGSLMYQRFPPAATVGMSISGFDRLGKPFTGTIESVRLAENEVVFSVGGGNEIQQSKTVELGGAKMNINDIIGRVVKKDKRSGLGFREDTFFPSGTPEGISGATPTGMRAITLDATKLTGVHSLNAGDHIDLMASVADFSSTANNPASTNNSAASLISATQQPKKGNEQATQPYLLAEEAIVLKPVYVRSEAESAASLTQGKRIQNVPKYEVAIAVNAEDVIALQSALHRQLSITCIARSMQPVKGSVDQSNPHGDSIQVPMTIRPILAYDVFHRDAFVSPATRLIRMEEVSQQQIDRLGIVASLEDVLGAIARHDIPSGSFIRQSDLLNRAVDKRTIRPASKAKKISASHEVPMTQQFIAFNSAQETIEASATVIGDRPSITKFIPQGQTAFAIPWNRIYGAEHLQIGDMIDLLASYSLERERNEDEVETRPDGTQIVRKQHSYDSRETERTWEESFGFRSEPWFVATEATVVAPVGFPAPSSALRALGGVSQPNTNANQSLPIGEGPPVIISVESRDVESVAAALATRSALFTVAFHPSVDSDNPDDENVKRIAVAPERVSAYEVFRETLWKGNRRTTSSRIVACDDPRFTRAILADEIEQYYQRTLRREKHRGEPFLNDDFLPLDSASGITGAVKHGYAIVSVSDREIEGLDNFKDGDQIAIVLRGMLKPAAGIISHGFTLKRPVSCVLIENATVVRSTVGRQTILEVACDRVLELQAALARRLSPDMQEESVRSNLIAIAFGDSAIAASENSNSVAQRHSVKSFDPLGSIELTELIIGKHRETHAYGNIENQKDTFLSQLEN